MNMNKPVYFRPLIPRPKPLTSHETSRGGKLHTNNALELIKPEYLQELAETE